MAQKSVGTEEQFEELLAFIKENRGFDFSGYKRPSLHRRIDKRMQDAGIDTYEQYFERLKDDEDEFAQLFDTILINVTGFFRDPAAWEYLRKEIVPKIVLAKSADEQIRLWSAGCATGEEAYSLAMVFADELGDEGFADRVKIYATDIDERALSDGRHGIFPADSVKDVPVEFQERYFEAVDSRFVFSADLRGAVIFGRNDLLVDPPISRLDLISTRNTLMYFNPDAQRRILHNFHFALLPTGYLFLGRSETLLTRSHLFVPVDLKKRIFSRAFGKTYRSSCGRWSRETVLRGSWLRRRGASRKRASSRPRLRSSSSIRAGTLRPPTSRHARSSGSTSATSAGRSRISSSPTVRWSCAR